MFISKKRYELMQAELKCYKEKEQCDKNDGLCGLYVTGLLVLR